MTRVISIAPLCVFIPKPYMDRLRTTSKSIRSMDIVDFSVMAELFNEDDLLNLALVNQLLPTGSEHDLDLMSIWKEKALMRDRSEHPYRDMINSSRELSSADKAKLNRINDRLKMEADIERVKAAWFKPIDSDIMLSAKDYKFYRVRTDLMVVEFEPKTLNLYEINIASSSNNVYRNNKLTQEATFIQSAFNYLCSIYGLEKLTHTKWFTMYLRTL